MSLRCAGCNEILDPEVDQVFCQEDYDLATKQLNEHALVRREQHQRTFNQTRERCAKVLDEMAEKAKHEAPERDDTESVIVVLEIGAARVRALPEEVGEE